MWIFTKYGFYSPVCARKGDGSKGQPVDLDRIMVRARAKEHLEALQKRFPRELGKLEIHTKGGSDYACRLFVDKAVWVKVVAALVEETDYDNFKGKVASHQGYNAYEKSLHAAWQVMYDYQHQEQKEPAAPAGEAAGKVEHIESTSGDLEADLCDYHAMSPELAALHHICMPMDGQPHDTVEKLSFPSRVDDRLLWALGSVDSYDVFGGGELGGRLYMSALGLDPPTVLELALALTLMFVLRGRKSVPFAKARQSLFELRRFAQGRAGADAAYAAAGLLHELEPSANGSHGAETDIYAEHMLPRALTIGAMFASFVANEPDSWRPYAERLAKLQDDFTSAKAPRSPSLASIVLPVLYYMGRRLNDPAATELVKSRLRARAIQARWETQGGHAECPRCLWSGTWEALEYMRSSELHPAIRVDGSGQFALPIGVECASGHGEDRRVEGYAFKQDGEAVYVVDGPDGLVAKRAWKANREYTCRGVNSSMSVKSREPGVLAWPHME